MLSRNEHHTKYNNLLVSNTLKHSFASKAKQTGISSVWHKRSYSAFIICLCFLSSVWVLCPWVSVFLSSSVLSACPFPWLPCFHFTFILVLTLFIYLSCLHVLWFSCFVRVCLTKFTCVYGLISLFYSCHLFPLLFFLFILRYPFCIIVLFQRYTVCISHLYAVLLFVLTWMRTVRHHSLHFFTNFILTALMVIKMWELSW